MEAQMADSNLIGEGINLYRQGNYTGALTYFLSLPEDCGVSTVKLAYYLGLCYAKLGRYDDSLLYLEQVVTSSDMDDSESSERILQCRYLLAVIYCLSGRKKLADFELNKLLETGYKKASVYASMAYVAWEQGDSSGSKELYTRALDEDPQNPTALNGLGYVLACEGTDLAKALGCCKRAVGMCPERDACLDSLGWVYYRMGLFSEARKFLERALKIAPDNALISEHLKSAQKDYE